MATSMKKRLLLTIDADWIPGSAPGLEALLDLCREYGIPSTIFVAGKFAQAYGGVIAEAASARHELGAHGWAHSMDMGENFSSTPYESQREWLSRATEAIQLASGVRPTVFRAPFLLVSDTMLRVLEEGGYRIDSSVPARRFDAGFGMVNGLGFFRAPLDPYHPHPQSLGKPGASPVLEVPPSSFIFPISMTALRLLGPTMTQWAARRVFNRAGLLNFYCHPWEYTSPEEQDFPTGFPKRHKTSIGLHNVELLRRFLDTVLSWGYEGATLSQAA